MTREQGLRRCSTILLHEEVGMLRGFDGDWQSPRDIARGGHISEEITGQRIGGILRRFETRGWVRRHPDDGRKVCLTKEGVIIADLIHVAYGDTAW